MTTQEMLARIEKLPSEWMHPSIEVLYGKHQYVRSGFFIGNAIALDLHIRHIAEKLASMDHETTKLKNGLWTNTVFLTADGGWKEILPTYPEALIAAAESVATP